MQTSTGQDARRLSLSFEGEVQGVGFRWTTQRLANRLGLTGWVRNEPDGSVSMELQGTNAQISQFFGELTHAWGYFTPNYVIADKSEIELINEDYFHVRF